MAGNADLRPDQNRSRSASSAFSRTCVAPHSRAIAITRAMPSATSETVPSSSTIRSDSASSG